MKNILVIIGLLICFLASGQNAKEEYNYSKRISMGCKMVVKDNAFGILDKEGELILPLEYEDIDFFSNGYVIVRKNKKNAGIGCYSSAWEKFWYRFSKIL